MFTPRHQASRTPISRPTTPETLDQSFNLNNFLLVSDHEYEPLNRPHLKSGSFVLYPLHDFLSLLKLPNHHDDSNNIVLRYLVRSDGSFWLAREGRPSTSYHASIPAHREMAEENQALAAGNLFFNRTTYRLQKIDNKSGDYQFSIRTALMALHLIAHQFSAYPQYWGDEESLQVLVNTASIRAQETFTSRQYTLDSALSIHDLFYQTTHPKEAGLDIDTLGFSEEILINLYLQPFLNQQKSKYEAKTIKRAPNAPLVTLPPKLDLGEPLLKEIPSPTVNPSPFMSQNTKSVQSTVSLLGCAAHNFTDKRPENEIHRDPAVDSFVTPRLPRRSPRR